MKRLAEMTEQLTEQEITQSAWNRHTNKCIDTQEKMRKIGRDNNLNDAIVLYICQKIYDRFHKDWIQNYASIIEDERRRLEKLNTGQ